MQNAVGAPANVEDLIQFWDGRLVDEESLHKVREAIRPSISPIVDAFYAAIDLHPQTARLVKDPGARGRLRASMHSWIGEILEGPYDRAYFERHWRIGVVHARIGLEQHFMFAAMNVLREEMSARLVGALSADDLALGLKNINRILDLELAIMIGVYTAKTTQSAIDQFRNLVLSNLRLSVFVLDEDDKISSWLSDPFGILKDTDVSGKPLLDVLEPDVVMKSNIAEQLQVAKDTQQEVTLPAVTLQCNELDARHLRISIIPVAHNMGSLIVHFEDVTKSVQAHSRAQHLENLANLGTMAATIAHEIRNPIAAVSATIQVVAKSFDKDDRRFIALGKVREQLHQLAGQVNDLLGFARPLRADARLLSLHELCESAVHPQRSTGISIVVEGEGQALVDAGLLEQVLINLVQNARHAGATRVVVEVADHKLQVIDNGPGMPPEVAQRAFVPFFTTKTRGTGLGLAFVKRATEEMGGKVRLQSDSTGTRFNFSFSPTPAPRT